MNAFGEFISNSGDESSWTPYHRLLERFIYRGQVPDRGDQEDVE